MLIIATRFKFEEVKKYVEDNSSCKLISNEYKNTKTKMLFLCSCGKVFETTFERFKLEKRQCNECGYKNGGKLQATKYENFKKFVEENSTSILLSKDYKNCHTKLKFKCKCGNEYEVEPRAFISNGKRQCNKCGIAELARRRSKSMDKFVNQIYDIFGDEFTVIGEYINCHTHLKVKHNKCGHIYNAYPSSLLRGIGCPICNESKGEKMIRSYLSALNADFIHQYRDRDCKNKKVLPFDFAVFDKGTLLFLIEYDGRQHYSPIEKFGGEKAFFQTKINDNIKNEFCKNNKIPLLRIPYWKFNDINNILDNYFKFIHANTERDCITIPCNA
nr:MAG TPA: restriction enzyme [Caudoviricetes sp.]